ncbi:MAG: alanine racemase [Saprospiraceae bacterium]|jgi:alanine racemase
MFHTSHIEISRSALTHNLRFIREYIGENVLLSSVVKGNAYGHGIEAFVPLAEDCGVNHFSVFSADEAFRVTKVIKGDCTIMIMGMLDKEQTEWAIRNDIEFFVFDVERLENACRFAKKIGKRAKIHIEVETGMNRTGFSIREYPKVVQILKQENQHIVFRGLCTHFAGAESIANYHRIKKQQGAYSRVLKRLTLQHLIPELKHTACSAATLRYPKTQMDLVRIGILQYGFFPSQEVLIHHLTKKKEEVYPLKRLITWKSKVMDIKSVKTGDFVGYGTSYLANSNMTIATIPIGYSHGFSRSLSNQGRVLIHGQQVNVIGMVNMNMISVNITNIEGVMRGDEVVIIGKQGDLEISVSSFSEFSDQVNYELLTRLPFDLPRKIIV